MPDQTPNNECCPEGAQPRDQDGVYLDDLAEGSVLELETKHHQYKVVKSDHRHARISGHPKFCPEPVTVEIEGSTEHGLTGLKPGFIGRGMHLAFDHPTYHFVTTSPILNIHRLT